MLSNKGKVGYGSVTAAILATVLFLKPIERLETTPYEDIGGVATVCYGATDVVMRKYSAQECEEQLIEDVAAHWEGIKAKMPSDAPESVKAAMISVAYNVGTSGWAYEGSGKNRRDSRFVVALAAHDWKATCDAITAPWQGAKGVAKGFKATVQGKPIRGLENRRLKERALCYRDLPYTP